mgnify:FL=1
MKQNKTKKEVVKSVEVLSVQDKSFIDTDIVSLIADAQSALLKRDEFIFKASENVRKLLGADFTKERWELVFSDIENRLVNTKGILPSTARNYKVEIVNILKLANPPCVKPLSTSRTAKIQQAKKDALTKKYEHESIENLKATLSNLAGSLDSKDDIKEFKEVQSVILKKTQEAKKAKQDETKQENKKFNADYTAWFKDLLSNEPQLLVAFRTNQDAIRKQYIKQS